MSKKVSLCSFVKLKLLFLIAVIFVFSNVSQAWAQTVNIEWTRQFGTSAFDIANGLAVVGKDVYVSGTTGGTLPGQTSQGGSNDAYVRKYDASGNEVWTRQFGTSGYDDAPSIAADATGSAVYVLGSTNGTFPGQTNAGDFDIYLRKYDASGNEVWTRQFGTSANDKDTFFFGKSDEAFAVGVDSTGVYATGYTYGTFPGQTFSGISDVFLRKYDFSGNEVWTRQFGTSAADIAEGITTDSTGVYIVGISDPLVNSNSDGFLYKYDANGNQLWAAQFGASVGDEATAVAVNSTGVYVVGHTLGTFLGETALGVEGVFDAFILKYDFNGQLVWTRQYGTSDNDFLLAASADSTGVYTTGYTYGTFPGQTRSGDADVFLRKYDTNGDVVWTRQFGTSDGENSWEVFAAPTGIYLSGRAEGTFSGQISTGGSDAFVVKLTQDSDSDGILDGVDTQPAAFSNDFSDGTTNGTITNRGDQNLTITDATDAVDGVLIKADTSGGATPAAVSVCGGAAVLSLNVGDSVTVTCGSVTVEVLNGIVDITFVATDGTLSTTILAAGNGLTFEPTTLTFTAPSTNLGNVVIFIEAVEHSLVPGETFHLVTEVIIDIKPNSDPNCFNNNDKGVIPVAILGSANFDVTKIDDSTVKLEGLAVKAVGKKGNLLSHIEDVNADGFSDLIVQIQDQDNTFQEGTTIATLTGKLKAEFGSTLIEGTDSICITP